MRKDFISGFSSFVKHIIFRIFCIYGNYRVLIGSRFSRNNHFDSVFNRIFDYDHGTHWFSTQVWPYLCKKIVKIEMVFFSFCFVTKTNRIDALNLLTNYRNQSNTDKGMKRRLCQVIFDYSKLNFCLSLRYFDCKVNFQLDSFQIRRSQLRFAINLICGTI